jgi:glycosyltransferase involved in cell wall biosynthesis
MVHESAPTPTGGSKANGATSGAAEGRQLKVCLVSYPYSSSAVTGRGLDRYTYELAENLAAECPQVALRLVDQGSSGTALAAAKKMVGFLASVFSESADVYHAISPIGGAMLIALGRAPLVVTIHDVIPFNLSAHFDSPLKYRVWRQCIAACVKRSDAIIVPHQVIKDEIVARLHGDASRIFVVNHGVDHRKYFVRPELPRVPRRIVYLGEVSRSKGVDVLMRAFAIVKKSVTDAELIISGKRSNDEEMLQGLARSLGMQGMTLRGYISEQELPDYYATAEVMVFPSRCGFGLSTLEAMACGTPVVAARALDAPEFIGDAGLLAEPDDPEDLARHLIRLLEDARLRAELSAKGVARAGEFSWAKMARETLKIYEGCR